MYKINVLVLIVLTLLSCTQGYIVPLCMEDGDACGQRLAFSLPGFSFYTQFCLTSPEESDSAVSQLYCTCCDLINHFSDLVSTGVQCILDNGQSKKAESYYDIMIQYLGLEHLFNKEQRTTCLEEVIYEHYSTAVCIFMLSIFITIYTFFFRKRKVVELQDQLMFIDKFQKGDEIEESSKDDLSSITEQEDSI